VESAAEWALVTQLARFPEVVRAAADARNIAAVANFALDTARLFTTFYHDCPVLNAGSPEQRDARLLLCAATRRTLENALGLLGLAAPERM
jgi:arginyl-tRNA synthetase